MSSKISDLQTLKLMKIKKKFELFKFMAKFYKVDTAYEVHP